MIDDNTDTSGAGYPINENYGSGAYHRRIRLTGSPGKVVAELEDCNHGFKVTIHHSEGKVTEILPEFLRIPFNTCSSADMPIKKLLGCDITTPKRDLNMHANPLSNCTHLLDLSLLAIDHANKGSLVTQYDVEVKDAVDGTNEIKAWRDKELVHHWFAKNFVIAQPENLAGKTLLKGFAAWANEQFTGLEQDMAFILQKGNFVSMTRWVDVNKMAGRPAVDDTTMHNGCHTYSPEIMPQAFRLENTVRDYTDNQEQLLKFL